MKPEEKWVYSKVFREDRILYIHLPGNDTCDVCDKLQCKIKNEKEFPKLLLKKDLDIK